MHRAGVRGEGLPRNAVPGAGLFRGQRLAVAGKESWLEGGELKHTYTLRSGGETVLGQTVYNYGIIGASVAGTVVEAGPESSV